MNHEPVNSTPQESTSYPTTPDYPETPEQQTGDVERIEKDSTFYLEHVTILVENALFKVPRYPFEQSSEVFGEMFSLPTPEGGAFDGCDDNHPLRLEQIKKEDFKPFLKALFQGPFKQENLPVTVAEWTSVLKLSTMWDFDILRENTIQHMSGMNIECVEKALVAMDYKVDVWLVPALNELAKREQPITLEEMRRLGPELTLKMAAVRESVRMDIDEEVRCRHCRRSLGSGSSMVNLGYKRLDSIDFTTRIREILVQTRNL